MTPSEAAERLGVNAKRVRRWLRQAGKAPTHGRWVIDEATFAALEAAVAGTPARARPHPRPGARVRDEVYVVDLCDEMFGSTAARQHRFDWLRGDVGPDGRPRRLPVDAYCESLCLVVEYRELQHAQPVAFFDKPDKLTISGVDRGAQRRIYDERRDAQIPEHGLLLWVITPGDVGGDTRGRLTSRDHDRDIELLRGAWRRFTNRVGH